MSTPLETWLEKVNEEVVDISLEFGVATLIIYKLKEALEHADRYIDYAMEFDDVSKNTIGIEIIKEALAIDPEKL